MMISLERLQFNLQRHRLTPCKPPHRGAPCPENNFHESHETIPEHSNAKLHQKKRLFCFINGASLGVRPVGSHRGFKEKAAGPLPRRLDGLKTFSPAYCRSLSTLCCELVGEGRERGGPRSTGGVDSAWLLAASSLEVGQGQVG